MKKSEEYHTGQEDQNQIDVPTQVDQISPSTFRRCDYYVHNAYIADASTSNEFTFSSSKILTTTMTSATPKNHGKLLNEWCREI